MHYADWFARHAATRPNRVAIATPQGRITYRDFHRALHATAFRLKECGIESGQTVAICALDPMLLCLLIASLNRVGCVPMVTNRPLRAGAAVQLPSGLRVDRILLEQPYQGEPVAGALDVHLDWLKVSAEETRVWSEPGLRDENARAHIFTSSGTTGTPKAVPRSTADIEAHLFKLNIGILATSRLANTAIQFGLRSAIGYQGAFATLWAGGTVFLGFPEVRIPALVARQAIERIEASPVQYQAILAGLGRDALDLSSLKLAVVGGSPISASLVAQIRNRLCRTLIGRYGATEIGMCAFGPLRASDPPGHSGHLVPWMEAEAIDADGNVVKAGEEGVLRFRCAEMAGAYLNDAEATATHFRDGWFYPGDNGAIGETRTLTISGREKDVINAGGVKVAPEAIEKVVRAFAGVKDCASFGIADHAGIETIWAAVVADDTVDLDALAKFCRPRLGVRAPRRFLKLAELPRNETGKIMRNELQRLAAGAGAP
jgi:acyl-coenzyme A synthetase/AMP-(fatty) acid ligase